MMMGAVGGNSEAAMDQAELESLIISTISAKLSQVGSGGQRHVHLQLLLGFAGGREAREQRAVEQVAEHEVDRKEHALNPGEVDGEVAGEQRRGQRGAMKMAAPATTQMAICVRPTAPTPISLPASMSLGLAMASITSKMREVFSWMMERATFRP